MNEVPMTASSKQMQPPRDLRQHYLDQSPPPGSPPAPDMVWIPGGSFRMGCNAFYPEERPERPARVAGFWMDRGPVTNAKFRTFVEATGYRTTAEAGPRPEDNPGIDPALLKPGGMVFKATKQPVNLDDPLQWWSYVTGANWRLPFGRPVVGTAAETHPVVHISYRDALAYADWVGGTLPSEAEWEFAARGGLDGAIFGWGNREMDAQGRRLANTWQGKFPCRNTREDGYLFTSPVGAFPANGYGLSDMMGNVWEWTCDLSTSARCGCGPSRPADNQVGPADLLVLKGGSYLCSPDYCYRYRPAARSSQSPDLSTCHLGFRCIIRPTSLG